MASGVGVADECLRGYNEIQMGHRWLYIIFKVSDDKTKIVIEEKAAHDKTYSDFVATLKQAEARRQCRYAVLDVRFLQNDVPKEKLAFFMWSPETATVHQKILYTTSKQAFKAKLKGLCAEIQCTEDADLTMSNILERVSSKYE